MEVAQGYSTKDDSKIVTLKYNQCPICKLQWNEAGFNLHLEEWKLRKRRMDQRKLERQLGPRMLLKNKKNKLF